MKTIAAKRQRGAGLLEPLIAIVILAFGLLGLARFQLGMVAQTTDSQARLSASAAAEDLLTQVRVDLANAACYQVPEAGLCASPVARARAAAWVAQANQGLPGFVSAGAVLAGNLFTVTLRWTSKTSSATPRPDDAPPDERTHMVTTDVRI